MYSVVAYDADSRSILIGLHEDETSALAAAGWLSPRISALCVLSPDETVVWSDNLARERRDLARQKSDPERKLLWLSYREDGTNFITATVVHRRFCRHFEATKHGKYIDEAEVLAEPNRYPRCRQCW